MKSKHMEEQRRVEDTYVIGETLSSGCWGKIKEGTDLRTGRPVALKFLNVQEVGVDSARKEAELQARLNHPGIVELLDYFPPHDESSSCCLVLEYVSGTDLLELVMNEGTERLSEAMAAHYFKQIVEAASYLHQNGVVHRDLKLENVMITPDHRCKIVDFGFATTWSSRRSLDTPCGTLEYAAPEVLSGRSYHGPKADVWSLGVMMYCSLTGFVPWQGDNQAEQFSRILRGFWTPSPYLPPLAADFVEQCLQVDPDRRAGILDLCEHPFITGGRPEEAQSKAGRAKSSSFRLKQAIKSIIKA